MHKAVGIAGREDGSICLWCWVLDAYAHGSKSGLSFGVFERAGFNVQHPNMSCKKRGVV
jgi:hypothetical protein